MHAYPRPKIARFAGCAPRVSGGEIVRPTTVLIVEDHADSLEVLTVR